MTEGKPYLPWPGADDRIVVEEMLRDRSSGQWHECYVLVTRLVQIQAHNISNDHWDDLVQEALAKALTNIDLVRPETNMVVWLCTFLHNQLGSDCRKPRREIADMERISMVSPPAQIGRLEFKATWRATLTRLHGEVA